MKGSDLTVVCVALLHVELCKFCASRVGGGRVRMKGNGLKIVCFALLSYEFLYF